MLTVVGSDDGRMGFLPGLSLMDDDLLVVGGLGNEVEITGANRPITDYLDVVAKMAEQHEVHVVWRDPPVRPEILEVLDLC